MISKSVFNSSFSELEDVIIGVVLEVQPADDPKYGEGAWLNISGVSVKASISADNCPAVGEIVAVRIDRRGKMLLGVDWSFVDLADGKELTPLALKFNWRPMVSRNLFTGGISRSSSKK